VVGSLFAGIVNSGITASWMLIYLASQPQWMARARKEITDTAAKYSTNPEASLIDQIDSLPLEIWETKFPFLDMCLKDTIRLQLPAALLRKNISGSEVQVGDEILPNGVIAVCFPTNLLRE
jgi:sterol 14-demethylase